MRSKFKHTVNIVAKLTETVIAAIDHDLPATSESFYRHSPVEQFVTCRVYQQIVIHANGRRDVQGFELCQMIFGQFVFLSRIKILLRAEIAMKAFMWRNRRVHKYRTASHFFGQPGRVKPAERTAYEGYFLSACSHDKVFENGNGLLRPMWKRRAGELLFAPNFRQAVSQLMRFMRCRRTIEPVYI